MVARTEMLGAVHFSNAVLNPWRAPPFILVSRA